MNDNNADNLEFCIHDLHLYWPRVQTEACKLSLLHSDNTLFKRQNDADNQSEIQAADNPKVKAYKPSLIIIIKQFNALMVLPFVALSPCMNLANPHIKK